MKKLSNQLSFESLLEEDVPLKPHIVMWSDPRWDSALVEMSTAPHVGIDIEFWADADGDPATAGDADEGGFEDDDDLSLDKDEEDPANTIIRLVQVALPSGLCVVADFGGIADDRTARRRRYGDEGAVDVHVIDQVTVAVPRYTPGSFLTVLRDLCESTTRQKRLQNAKGDALRLRHAFGIRMRCIRCTMIASQLYWAGVRGLRHGLGFLSERAVAAGAVGVWAVSKRLQQSEWRWHLSNAQINYAADDALLMSPLWEWLAGRLRAAGMTATAMAEMNAIAPFVEFEFHGMPVNPAMLEDHLTLWRRGREEAIKPFLARYPGVDPSRTQVVAVAMTQDSCYGSHRFYKLDSTRRRRNPVWIHGERFDFAFQSSKERYDETDDASVSEAVLSKWAHLPWVSALLDWRSLGVVIKWMENVQRRVRSDGRVRGEYAQIAGGESRAGDDNGVGKGMGRSACVAKGSLVDTIRDSSGNMVGIPIEDVRPGDLVYTYTSDGSLTIKPVTHVWDNGIRPVVRVHWRGEGHQHSGYVDLTADHPVRLTSGEYRQAGKLKPWDRVSALRRGPTGNGYARLWVTGNIEITREHRFIYETLTGKSAEHIHHINGNKLDNRLENLQGMSNSEHTKLHGKEQSPSLRHIRSVNGRRAWFHNEAENRARLTEMQESLRTKLTYEEVQSALEKHGWSLQRAAEDLDCDRGTFSKHAAWLGFDLAEIRAKAIEFNKAAKRGRGYNKKPCKKCGEQHFNIQKCKPANNHQIVKVEDLGVSVQVYDLTVADTHNFIVNEICVHNCRAPSLQQSANPQPKLSAIIHAAAGFSGKPVSYSPRLPFVAHDANAAAYLRWAAARLRGEAEEPLARRTVTTAGWLGDGGEAATGVEAPVASTSPPSSAPARAAWYDRLAVEWETNPRGFGVADFSQAHMRIAAQASQDPQLREDFRLDRDAHLKLAYDFGKATGQIELDVPIETFFGWYTKGHPKQPFVKELRQPAKTGNYTKLNLGSVARLKGAGDTAKPPVVLETSAWQLISDAWLSRYSTLAQFQRHVVDKANAYDVVIDGEHYGIGWSLRTGRRLYLRKQSDRFSRGEPRYCPDCGKTHGRLTVKATDAVAFTWLSTEADAIKWALGRILDEFDAHDAYWMARGLRPKGEVWDAHMCSMAHDELDFTARKAKMVAAAGCVRKWFNEGLRWSGVVDIPVEGGAVKDSDLVVACWADK